MSLRNTIENDMKLALKGGDSLRLSALRLVLSAVKMLEIEKKASELTDMDMISIIQKQIKQRRESIEQFEKGGRHDLADKEKKELEFLIKYLPEQLSESELIAIINSVISETGASSKSDMGKVMKAVNEKTKGRADGKVISQHVSKILK